MKRLDPYKGLLILVAALLAFNLAIQFRPAAQSSAPILHNATAETLQQQFLPTRPQWLVTAEPDGKAIYVWKYNGLDYESDRYEYTPGR